MVAQTKSTSHAAVCQTSPVALFREVVNRSLTTLGLEVRQKPRGLVRSENELAMTLEFVAAHLMSRRGDRACTVLQIGVFDGQANDPVRGLLTRYPWRGVLVEPQPAPFAALEDLHRQNERVQVFNIAVGAEDGKRALYMLEAADDLPSWVGQVSSFDRAHVEAHQTSLPGVALGVRVIAIEVPTWTFATLLSRAAIDGVDVLQIDVEGYDYEILRLFDVGRRLPAIINYEHVHLSRSDRNAAADLLIGCGYRLALNYGGGDTVAYRIPED